MIVVYDGHEERGPEERAMTFVLPFVAAVLIFDETMARNLDGSGAVRSDGLVEAEAHGVQEMRGEPLGVAKPEGLPAHRGRKALPDIALQYLTQPWLSNPLTPAEQC